MQNPWLLCVLFVCWRSLVKAYAETVNGGHRALLQGNSALLQDDTQGQTITTVRLADFSAISGPGDHPIAETEIGSIDVAVPGEDADSVQYGAFPLGPKEVQRLKQIMAVQRVITAVEAVNTNQKTISFPGATYTGVSVEQSLSGAPQLRIPTLFSPEHAGVHFSLEGRSTPPGTTLYLSNITLFLGSSTYGSLGQSALLNYIDFGASSRLCVTNGMFVLQSCRGFNANSFHMWCCTKRQCNIQYTQEAIEDLGYVIDKDLEFLTCHDESGSGQAGTGRGAGSRAPGGSLPVAGKHAPAPVLLVDLSGVPEEGEQHLLAEASLNDPSDPVETVRVSSPNQAVKDALGLSQDAFYYLTPEQVLRLGTIIKSKRPEVPASEVEHEINVQFQGRELKGKSMPGPRVPSIFAPFHANTKFTLEGRQNPPGTTLEFSNVTLFVGNATYESLCDSGIRQYFDLGTSSRVCFTNSIFVLQSCKGFSYNSFHMFCLSGRTCSIQYTQQAVEDLGYPLDEDLDLLTCFDSSGNTAVDGSAAGSSYGGITQFGIARDRDASVEAATALPTDVSAYTLAVALCTILILSL